VLNEILQYIGKAVLFPVINFITSYAEEPSLKTEEALLSYAKSNVDDIAKKEASINNVNFTDLEKYCFLSFGAMLTCGI
jgi:hypothetical protein